MIYALHKTEHGYVLLLYVISLLFYDIFFARFIVSVGLEHVDDLKKDMDQALALI